MCIPWSEAEAGLRNVLAERKLERWGVPCAG
jgi:hypothetical protein